MVDGKERTAGTIRGMSAAPGCPAGPISELGRPGTFRAENTAYRSPRIGDWAGAMAFGLLR
jgi:hypothetical protein